MKSTKCDCVPLSCRIDQLPLSTFGPGWGSETGGAQGSDRVSRGWELPEPEAKQEDHDVAGWFAECIFPSAASNAEGVHHALGLWSVSTTGEEFCRWDGESTVFVAGSNVGMGQSRWCGGDLFCYYTFPPLQATISPDQSSWSLNTILVAVLMTSGVSWKVDSYICCAYEH